MKKVFMLLFILLLTVELFPQQKLGKHTVAEWRYIIDTTWGPGQTTTEKLQIFDTFWNAIDQRYAGFHGIEDNWQQLRSYRDTVALGVSRGRFAGILGYLVKSLNDGHVYMLDRIVASTPLNSGVPLLYPSGVGFPSYNWNAASHFGAALTPLPDSTLLVYSAAPNHPFGLAPGDIILGYDRKLWKDLYKELLEVQFPMAFFVEMYSAERAATHQWLQAAGMNWHLFDTIDVVKYGTNDTLHFSTNLLTNPMPSMHATEQLPIAGVPFPDGANQEFVSNGYSSGTKIGYIYVLGWGGNSEGSFFNAVNSFFPDSCSNGLIIDLRLNEGGGGSSWMKGFNRLFNQNVEKMGWLKRASSSNHSLMQYTGVLFMTGHDAQIYDRPIAVLCGPSAISHGDWSVHVLRDHPMGRTFGLPTNGAFGSYTTIPGISPEWLTGSSEYVLYALPDMNDILSHQSVPVDEEIWLTRNGVANGEDDVVKRALEWINNLVYGHNLTTNASCFNHESDTIKITCKIENPNSHLVSSKVYFKNLQASFIDSVDLQKVGLSGESEIWSSEYVAPIFEDIFKLSLSVNDISHSNIRLIENVSHFTTAGPVKLDSIRFLKGITNYYNLRPFVRNHGNTLTITNAKIQLRCSDPWVYGVAGAIDILSIPPGTSVGASSWIAVTYYDSIFPGYFNFKVEISSDGWIYWTDSIRVNVITEIEGDLQQPLSFKLEQNYPNPFNPSTKISWQSPVNSRQVLNVFDVLGNEVATLINEYRSAGNYEVEFNASNLASGIYFYQLLVSALQGKDGNVGESISTKKMVLIR